MSWRPDRYAGLRALLRGPRLEEEVREEFEHHLEERIASNVARGLSPAAARADALRRFGDLERFRGETLAVDRSTLKEQKRMELLEAFRRELRHAARGLVRAPVFSLISLMTLALGIGAATAVFTLLKEVVLDPLPYPESDRLVVMTHAVPGIAADAEWGMSTASYFHFRARATALEDLALYNPARLNVRAAGDASVSSVLLGTPNLFSMLGARASAGRLFRPEDGSTGAAPVAVLSYGYWQREYGGRAAAVGRTITVEGQPAKVIGVVDEGFAVPEQEADVYLPLGLDPAGPHYNSHYLFSVGRLRRGATLATLDGELSRLTGELADAYPSVYSADFMRDTRFAPVVRTLHASVVEIDVARTLWVLVGAVVVVLLIAAANVANLFLVRSEGRRTERAVRSALGAERAHLFVQAGAEALLLCLSAGAAAIWIAHGALRLLVRMAPAGLPRLTDVELSGTTASYALLMGLSLGVVLALFPVLHHHGDHSPLREAGRGLTASPRQARLRSVLVTGQIALALVLLASAGLLLRSFQRMRDVNLGFDPSGVLTLQVSLPYSAYGDHDRVSRFWEAFLGRLESLPGVVEAGGTIALPMGGGSPCAVLDVTPAPVKVQDLGCPGYNVVTPGYFEAAGIAVRGRVPTWADIHSGTGAVVISANLAQTLWPGENPIGRGVRVPSRATSYYRIVGVATDVHALGVREPPPALVYYPIRPLDTAPLWQAQNALVVMVRTSSEDPAQLTAAARSALRELEPSAALGAVETWQAQVDRSMSQTSFVMVLLGAAGAMALLLAILGLYGVTAYIVSQRRGEIGVRMAFGAGSRAIGGMIVLQALKLATIGVTIGLVVVAATTKLLRALLYDVTPTDPITLTGVACLLLAIAVVAAFVPARRAADVSPLEALRE